MNVPPEYCVGCEEVIQQTQEHIKNNFFYKDEYNRVVTCVVNNKYAFEKDLNFQPPWLLAGRVKPLGRFYGFRCLFSLVPRVLVQHFLSFVAG